VSLAAVSFPKYRFHTTTCGEMGERWGARIDERTSSWPVVSRRCLGGV